MRSSTCRVITTRKPHWTHLSPHLPTEITFVFQFLNAAALQLNMVLTTHLPSIDLVAGQTEASVVRLINCLTNTMLALFSTAPLARVVSRTSLKQLTQILITVLLDDRLASMEDGPQILRTINVLMVKVVENPDQTVVFGWV